MMLTVKQITYIFLVSAILASVCVFGICRNFDEEIIHHLQGTHKLPRKSTPGREDGCSDREMSFIWLVSMGFMVVFSVISEELLTESQRVRAHVQAFEQQPIHIQQPAQLPQTFPEDEKASIPSEECLICKENKRIYTALACGHLVACASCKQQIETRRCPLCNKANAGWLRTFY